LPDRCERLITRGVTENPGDGNFSGDDYNPPTLIVGRPIDYLGPVVRDSEPFIVTSNPMPSVGRHQPV
jgi:hypothetical protein